MILIKRNPLKSTARFRLAMAEPLESRLLLTSVVVNTTQDAIYAGGNTGLVSLRDAVNTANGSATPTTITFDTGVNWTHQTILLTKGVLELKNATEPTTIVGPSVGVTVSGNNSSGVFEVDQHVTASLSNLAISHGIGTQDPVYPVRGIVGGGILSYGTLTLAEVSVVNNTAGQGGGVFADDGSLTINDSTIASNTASSGAGGGVKSWCPLSMTNATVTANRANDAGGGLSFISATLIDTTVSGNTDTPDTGNVGGGGICFGSAGLLTIGNSIIAGNTCSIDPDAQNFQSTINSLGGNVIGNTAGTEGSWGSTDLTGTAASPLNAKLGSLANNGGITQTLLPLAGSPAIDAGINALIPAGVNTDQRGLPRISNGTVDIGAVETQTASASSVNGEVFDDNNNDGKLDDYEVGIPYVQVYDDVNNNGSYDHGEPFAITDNYGSYSMTVPGASGTAVIRQIVHAPAYSQTLPAGANAGITVKLAGSALFNIDFGDTPINPTVVKGEVFTDTNANAKLDSGEAGFPSVTVYDDANNAGSYTAGDLATITDSSGNYSLALPGTGSAVIREIVHSPAYKQTLPALGYGIAVSLNSTTYTGENFGEAPTAPPPANTVSGLIFSDKNSNTKLDSGEGGVGGVTVYLDANNNSKLDPGEASAVTASNGSYTISAAGSGAVVIRQILPANYSQTLPTGGLGIHITLAGSSSFTGENFGDHDNSQINSFYPVFGTVFNDANKNGKLDSGETGIAGVTVYGDTNNNGKLDAGEPSDVTAADGSYALNFSATGATVLRQVLPTGDTQTLPGGGLGIHITIGTGSNTNQDFGDTVPAVTTYTFSGTVFDDTNKNGKQDTGEAGLAGWEVYNDANNNSVLDAGEASTFTNASGAYSITLSGSGKLREIRPANWSQTTPANNYGITVTSSSTKTGNNFGDYTAVKYLSTVATTSGLVGWWTFDSNANSIVNGYTGTLTGGATIASTGGAPISGESSSSGLSLNGSTAYVDTNLTTQQQFATAATYNVWINLSSLPASGTLTTIVAKSVFGNDLDLFVGSDGTISFYTDNGTNTSFTPSSITGWHMVTAEFDTVAKTRSIFWDGNLVASTANYTGTHSANTGTLSIGESDVFTGRFFDGKIDEVSLWNRALTAAEVLAIYNASKG